MLYEMNILFASCSLQFITLAFKISAFELFHCGKLTYIKLGFFSLPTYTMQQYSLF